MTEKEVLNIFQDSNIDIGWNIEQAYAKRKCHACGGEIVKGEYHLATYRQGRLQHFEQRKNVCMDCGLPAIQKRAIDSTHVMDAIETYLKMHPQIKNRKILTQMKEGTYKPEAK
jgi:ribosomal protein L37E